MPREWHDFLAPQQDNYFVERRWSTILLARLQHGFGNHVSSYYGTYKCLNWKLLHYVNEFNSRLLGSVNALTIWHSLRAFQVLVSLKNVIKLEK